MRGSDLIFSIVAFELTKPPFFSKTTWGITPRILFLSSSSKPFITETTVINTATPMLTPRVVSIEREDNFIRPLFKKIPKRNFVEECDQEILFIKSKNALKDLPLGGRIASKILSNLLW